MAPPFLISIDLDASDSEFDLTKATCLRYVYITFTPQSVGKAIAFVEENVGRLEIYADCRQLRDASQIVKLIHSGSQAVFITPSLLQDANVSDELKVVPQERIIPFYENLSAVQRTDSSEQLQYCVDYRNVATTEGKALKGQGLYVLLQGEQEIASKLSRNYVSIVPSTVLSTSSNVTNDRTSKRLPVSQLITAFIRSDREDALFPTIVATELGISLGLVYSSLESIQLAIESGRGIYYSRSRKRIWKKGEESGNTQELLSISFDCDSDTLLFRVRQKGPFCHLGTSTCFGTHDGLSRLQETLIGRKASAPPGSYTARLFNDGKLLNAKIMEEASELCEAQTAEHIASEAADLIYFALAKCIAAGVQLDDVARDLDRKSLQVTRRRGDAKPQWAKHAGLPTTNGTSTTPAADKPVVSAESDEKIRMRRFDTQTETKATIDEALRRPSQKSTNEIMGIVKPIIEQVRTRGDAGVLEYTHKFDGATSLASPILKAPFSPHLMQLSPETKSAIDISYDNIRRFHMAQKEVKPLEVETMPGVTCTRFARPIERVGLYVPGGTAVLPSTALMLGVPAQAAQCETIVIASPPRRDGSISPEIVYIAHKIGAESILLAGGAQAIAALAYGTESISKVDKILGPGNQFVTAAKMLVSNDTEAAVSIDMPAGPSEVLVIADETANPAFVAADLLSQAEHGVDSQVVLIAIGLDQTRLSAIEQELESQALALPRAQIVRKAIAHSVTLLVSSPEQAMLYSNRYAPEHLILQVRDTAGIMSMVKNAGSCFIGHWTPESVGDYSAGVNHSLPTYGFAKQYSGVNLSSFTKSITSSSLTREGLQQISTPVMQLAQVEGLEAHRRAVSIRLARLDHGN